MKANVRVKSSSLALIAMAVSIPLAVACSVSPSESGTLSQDLAKWLEELSSKPQPVTPNTASPTVTVLQPASLLDGPDSKYDSIGRVSQGDLLNIIGQFSDCAWLKLRAPDGWVGWTSGDSSYMRLEIPCDDIPYGTFRPFTGMLNLKAGAGGKGELLIKNGTDGDGVVVVAKSEDQPVMAVYLRSGASYRIMGIANGNYQLFFSTGDGWDGDNKRFTDNVKYQRFEENFPYQSTLAGYTIWEVTLYPILGGNASTERVDPDQFPTLR